MECALKSIHHLEAASAAEVGIHKKIFGSRMRLSDLAL